MSYHDAMKRAQEIEAAHQRGDYDTQLGISTEARALLTKAAGTEPLTTADVRDLTAMNRHDLVDAAFAAGRLADALNPKDAK